MKSSILIAVIILAATASLHAQGILDIEPGWPRDSAMKVLKGKYRVADTAVIPGRSYDHIIRMAPVDLAGYGGFVALHSDSTGNVTSIVWSRIGYNIYTDSSKPWNAFRDWEEWGMPTATDYQSMLDKIAARFDSLDDGKMRMRCAGMHDSTDGHIMRQWSIGTVHISFTFDKIRDISEIRFVREILLPAWPGITDAPLKEQDYGDEQ
jgi:hypothetical protein